MPTNDRRQKLLEILAGTSEEAPITIEKLSRLLAVSPRTVRYDLDALEADPPEGVRISRQSRKGTWLTRTEAARVRPVFSAYVPSKRERCDYIMLALADSRSSSIDSLADELMVSRNTLLIDLKDVQEKLADRGLSYASKRGVGIWAEGSEQALRDAIIHVLSRTAYDFRRYGEGEARGFYETLLRRYADGLPVREVAEIFLRTLSLGVSIENDLAVSRMICALLVGLKRERQGYKISEDEPVSFVSSEGEELLTLAGSLARELSRLKGGAQVEPPAGEVDYIVRELLHSRIYFRPAKKATELSAMELAYRFITDVQYWMGDIYTDDEDLVYNVAMHLQPAIERARFGIELTNPLLQDIKTKYDWLYEVARRAASHLTEEMGLKLSDDEIGYLTIHLGSAVERHGLRRVRFLSVLLVCGNGIGTANLLAMTLRRSMPYIRIVKIVSRYNLKEEDLTSIDLVISTMELKLEGKAVLRVSPILQEAEIAIIKNQLQRFYDGKFAAKAAESALGLGLADLLTEEMIELNVEAIDWQDAIRAAGAPLLKAGAVTEHYIGRMAEEIEELGPYIVMRPGVAMPHARIEDGAKKLAVAFVRLKEPVLIKDSPHGPTDLFFAFSTVDEQAHLALMQDLWALFNDEAALNNLRAARTSAEVIAIVKKLGERPTAI